VAERAVQHGARGRGRVGWRIFSGLVVLSLVGVLFLFFSADIFYIHSINVAGLRYITKEEVYGLADIANMHLFWVDPTEVRRSLLRSPTIADAQVEVGWPPNMVQIVVEERQPALTWEQAGVATWVDLQGRVMRQRENRKDLVRIVADNAIEGPLGPNVQVPSEVVAGALQIKSLYPNIEMLRYNPNKGLGYQDGRGWEVWFGTGTDMPEKLRIYTAMVNNLLSRGIQPSEVNVVNPDAPYYRKLGA
jgi:cell division septal protein FtsQ